MDAIKLYRKQFEGFGDGWSFYIPYWIEEKANKHWYYTTEWKVYEFDMPMFVRGKVIGGASLLREDWLSEYGHYREVFPVYEEGIKISYDPIFKEINYTWFKGEKRDDESGYGYIEICSSKRLEDFDEG